jgi:hypothetical protein
VFLLDGLIFAPEQIFVARLPLRFYIANLAEKHIPTSHNGLALMPDSEHISIERMIAVATKCDVLLTDIEQHHLHECRECLLLFGGLILPDDEGKKGSK